MSLCNLHVDVIVVPGGPAALKPDVFRGDAKPLRQVRLDKNLLHAEAAPLIGQPTDRFPRPLFFERPELPERLQGVQVPATRQ